MINSDEIKYLNPVLQRAVTEFLKRCNAKGLNVKIKQTLRDAEYQNSLYAKGRTVAPIGEKYIVTNAKGGSSNHNYGLAFDICKNVRGHEYDDPKFFIECGKIWEDMGGVWGGNFDSFVDRPHFEFTNGLTISQLKQGKTVDESVKMRWEEMSVTKTKMLVDGVEKDVNVILFENKNYVELRELKKFGMGVDYKNNMPIVNTKK